MSFKATHFILQNTEINQLYCHPPSTICSSVTQHPIDIYLGLHGDVSAHKGNLWVPYVWLQMGNGDVEGHEGKKVCTLNISSVVRLPECES